MYPHLSLLSLWNASVCPMLLCLWIYFVHHHLLLSPFTHKSPVYHSKRFPDFLTAYLKVVCIFRVAGETNIGTLEYHKLNHCPVEEYSVMGKIGIKHISANNYIWLPVLTQHLLGAPVETKRGGGEREYEREFESEENLERSYIQDMCTFCCKPLQKNKHLFHFHFYFVFEFIFSLATGGEPIEYVKCLGFINVLNQLCKKI